MNERQYYSIAKVLIATAAGLLASHGLLTFELEPLFESVGLLLSTLIWSYFQHRDDKDKSE